MVHGIRPDCTSVTSRDSTRSRVFQVLAGHNRISRPEIARITGLSRATVALVADELMEAGLVTESGAGSPKGGRPPIILQFLPSAACAIGASLYDYAWRIVATDLSSHVIDRETEVLPDRSAAGALSALSDGIARLRKRLEPDRLLPVLGIGPPGLVDMEKGIIRSAVDLGWREVDLATEISRRTGMAVAAANRSKAGALAVLWRVAKRETANLIYVSLGTGVAAGIILEGRLFTGSNSSAGELGHMTVLPDGPLCECGNKGCLQQLVSEQAIENAARRAMRNHPGGLLDEKCGNHPEVLTAFDVLDAAEQQDPTATAVVNQVADYLAIALGNLINLFNPQSIVLGGPVAEASPLLTELVQKYTRRHAMAYPLSAVHITRNTLGPETGAIGAAVLVLQHADRLYFQLPHWAAQTS
jgi:predicted NBD/HSP70 family sugar kinase